MQPVYNFRIQLQCHSGIGAVSMDELSNCKCHVASDYCSLVLPDSPEGRESLTIVNRPFTKDLYSDGCLHNIEGQKNSDLDMRLKLPHTMLHAI